MLCGCFIYRLLVEEMLLKKQADKLIKTSTIQTTHYSIPYHGYFSLQSSLTLVGLVAAKFAKH